MILAHLLVNVVECNTFDKIKLYIDKDTAITAAKTVDRHILLRSIPINTWCPAINENISSLLFIKPICIHCS